LGCGSAQALPDATPVLPPNSSAVLSVPVAVVAVLARSPDRRSTRHGPALALSRHSCDLEASITWSLAKRAAWIAADTRQLIREMVRANFLWSAPRIHGELLKLSIIISQATVSRYMPVSHGGPSEAEMADISAEPRCRDCSQSDPRRAPLD
jgi:hypothetical protein